MRPERRVALYIDSRSSYDHGIARGIIRYAKERGAWRLFGQGWTLAEIKDPKRWHGDGIICRIRTRDEADALIASGLPVVDVAGGVQSTQIFPVTNDDFGTGRIAGEHFYNSGFRNFAYCGVIDAPWSQDRLAGLQAASRVESVNIAVFQQSLEWWEKPGCPQNLKRWLSSLKLPIGVFACNDSAGVKVTAACQVLKLTVPQQVAVVGVDNEEVLCELASPSLSSIPCDCARMGYEAARVLDGLMQGGELPKASLKIPPQPLVTRASSDTLAISDDMVSTAVRFIRSNSDLSINVSDVLRAVPLCRRSLEIRFRKALGHTLHDEIFRTRFEHACRLLVTTDLPVAKIAVASGFSSHQRFHTVFRKQMKMAPLAYRKRRQLLRE